MHERITISFRAKTDKFCRKIKRIAYLSKRFSSDSTESWIDGTWSTPQMSFTSMKKRMAHCKRLVSPTPKEKRFITFKANYETWDSNAVP